MRRILCPLCSPGTASWHSPDHCRLFTCESGAAFFTSLSIRVCCGSWNRKLFPFSSMEKSPGSLPHPSCLSPGLCLALRRGFHSPRSLLSPPSQVTRFLLKVIIFVFLIPKAPSIRRNTLCRKGSDSSRVQPWGFHPSCAMDLCDCLCWVPGNTTAKSTYTLEVFDPGRQNTLSKGEGGETRM